MTVGKGGKICCFLVGKGGKDYKTHSALTYFMSTSFFKRALVFSNHNVSAEGDVIYLPMYMTMFLNKEEIIANIESDSLSQLKPPYEK